VRYKFTILYYTIFVVPFLLYATANVYLYIFTNNYTMSKKVGEAGAITLMTGLAGVFVWLWEEVK